MFWSDKKQPVQSNASLFISATGAAINLVCILIVNQIYGYVALWLTELELNRTQTEFDDSLSLKIYILQFVNYYGSIFYVAFFKGQFIGYPGDYNRFFGYRQSSISQVLMYQSQIGQSKQYLKFLACNRCGKPTGDCWGRKGVK